MVNSSAGVEINLTCNLAIVLIRSLNKWFFVQQIYKKVENANEIDYITDIDDKTMKPHSIWG